MDPIKMTLKCVTCTKKEADTFFYLDVAGMVIKISADTPVGLYRLELKLVDENEVDPQGRIYSFSLEV